MTYSLNDARIVYFQSLGYTGTAGDMELQWLHALTGGAYPEATLQDLWGIAATAFGFTEGTTQERQKMVMEYAMQDFYTTYNEAEQQYYSQGSTFSPVDLFAGGVNGAWYDPYALGTLFQDSAGTIPVTNVGDPVGRMLDRSGNGHHMIQTTASKRPVLQEDSAGNLYLDFNGTDSAMVSEITVDLSAYTGLTTGMGLYRTNTSSSDSVLEHGRVGPDAVASNVIASSGFATMATAIRQGAAAPYTSISIPTVTLFTHTVLLDRTAGTVATQIVQRVNAATVANTPSGVAIASSSFPNYKLYLGARDQTVNPWIGRVYQCVVVGGILAGADLTSMETWVKSRTGVA